MNAFAQGWHAALVKLGLSGSAIGAANSGTTSGTTPAGTTSTATSAVPKAPKQPTPWSTANKIEPKMHEAAWNRAQKDLDTGESRAMAKVDQWQRPLPLPVGSA